jgi:alpha-beta hydrolase superfamily lysophospholipase
MLNSAWKNIILNHIKLLVKIFNRIFFYPYLFPFFKTKTGSLLASMILYPPLLLFLVLPLAIPSKIYYPYKELVTPYIQVQDVSFFTDDNITLSAWYSKAKHNKPTVIFCHGNGGNISYYQEIIKLLTDNGYGVLAIDYRGYGKSGGKSSEKGLYTDLRSAVKYLKSEQHISENNIILWGLSLGGAVVAEVADEGNFKGVILQSPFTSIRGMANHIILNMLHLSNDIYITKYMPIIQKFDNVSNVGKIKAPLLIAHAETDEVIPVKMTYELAKLNPKAQLFISKTGSHNTIGWFEKEAIEFIESLK